MRFRELHNTLKKYNLPVKITIDTDNGNISKYFTFWDKANTSKYDNLLVITSYFAPTQEHPLYIAVVLLGD